MQHEILYRPSYSLLVVQLEAGETLLAEAGAMVSMSASVEIETNVRGGLLSGLKRAVLGGESLFINTFRAAQAGEISFAPPVSGDIVHLPLNGETMLAQSGAFIASAPGVQIDTSWGGARGFFSGAGLVLLKLSGSGDLWLSSYGAIHEKRLEPGERYVVDTGHIVAFEGTTSYQVRRVGGLKSTFLSGEGLVAEFTGPGRILLQSRSPGAFLSWLLPQWPKRGSD